MKKGFFDWYYERIVGTWIENLIGFFITFLIIIIMLGILFSFLTFLDWMEGNCK